MSGIIHGHILSLTNGGKLPLALLPTCDTGSFAGSYACRSEAWLRAPNGGGMAAVGTATIGTHTRYNNCYYLGVWDGLLNCGDHRIGVAHTLGKLELYNNYYLAEPDAAEIWAVWNNLMGDPATAIWTRRTGRSWTSPSHAEQLAVGANAVRVPVRPADSPVAGALVCLYRRGPPGFPGSPA